VVPKCRANFWSASKLATNSTLEQRSEYLKHKMSLKQRLNKNIGNLHRSISELKDIGFLLTLDNTGIQSFYGVGCHRVVLKNNYSTPTINNIYCSLYTCTIILVVSSCVHFVS
jgi:hypothetical protein